MRFSDVGHTRFPIPNLTKTAFLIDFDGTLVETLQPIDDVKMPNGLLDILAGLRAACRGALAIISRRSMEDLDKLLGEIPFAMAGDRGATIRFRPGGDIEQAAFPPFPRHWLTRAHDLLGTLPGTRLEHITGGFILHYRAAPETETVLKAAAQGWVDESEGEFVLRPAHMAWEIRPRGIDKGYAVAQIMQRVPFVGRKPVYIGRDYIDEDGMQTTQRLGGICYRIPVDFPTPAFFRNWLASLVKEDQALTTSQSQTIEQNE